MKTIWKFPVPVNDGNVLEMPEGAEILSVQAQGETPCLWALVDEQSARESRTFRTFGTGHPIHIDALDMEHVGTYQLHGGRLVFHVFEIFIR